MNTDDAYALARHLASKHELSPEFPIVFTDKIGWCLGSCRFVFQRFPIEIVLSRPWVEILDEVEVKDVILHEIAHVLAGVNARHGPRWKEVAEQIGARPQQTASLDPAVIRLFQERYAKYLFRCPCEHVVAYRFRKHRRWRNAAPHCTRCLRKVVITTLR